MGVTAGEQNVQRAVEIDQGGLNRILHGARHRSQCGEVDDVVNSGKKRADGFKIANVRLTEVDFAPDLGEILLVTGRKVVENADGFSASNQLFHHVRADESCATGNQIKRQGLPPVRYLWGT